MPALLELRIRACHVRGTFVCKDNVAPAVSAREPMAEPAAFDYTRLAHPPVTFGHEKLKGEQRIPAARRYIAEHRLNEVFAGSRDDVGLIVQGGLTNTLLRSLQQLGLADAFGASEIPILVLNVTFPLVPEEIAGFCAGKRAVLVLEEGQPEYIEHDIRAALQRQAVTTALHGKDMLPAAGEYTVEVMAAGLLKFAQAHLPDTPGSRATPSAAAPWHRRWASPCRHARRAFAWAAPSARCSPRSSSRSKRSGRCTSRPTSVATRSPPSSRFRPAIRSSATA
jgi:indolepyruvate ferredoxin oxidoreductase alpha subunit